jgi:RES domain-containing protein
MANLEPGVQELYDAIAGCHVRAIPYRGVVMRSTSLRYATAKDFLSGDGAAQTGGRWNPQGIKAIYASASPVTAAYEAYRNFAAYGFAKSTVRPRVFCGAKVNLQQLLDLTNPGIRRRLGFTLAEMLDEDWLAIQDEGDESWTQAAGRGASMAGFEGLLVPSARDRPQGINVVIFPGKLRTGSTIRILGGNELPRHPPE